MPHMRWAIAVGALLLAPMVFAAAEAKATRDVELAQKTASSNPPKKAAPRDNADRHADRKPGESECAWVGKRITGLLARDDVQAASEFLRFYTTFDCPVAHLGKAFGCVVSGSGEVSAEAAGDRVDRCWFDPTTRVFPPKAETPAKANPKTNEKGQPSK